MKKHKSYLSVLYYVLGILRYRHLTAINFFEKSLKLDCPTSLRYLCYKEIGIVYYYNNSYNKSKLYLEKTLSLISDVGGDTELFTFLGLVYYAENDFLKAKKCFEEALRKYKKFEWIKRDYINSHIKGCEYYIEKGDKGISGTVSH